MSSELKTDQLPTDAITLRQAIFVATGGGITAVGVFLMFQLFAPSGLTGVEIGLLVLFFVLFLQIAFGFAIAFWGFVTRLRGGDPIYIMRSLPQEAATIPAPTAVVMPVFNEDAGRIFRGIENMYASLQQYPASKAFDFFILSDSNVPDRWIEEECAWVNLCIRLEAFGRIFYRKRRVSLHGKSGNVADFLRRWGKRYTHLVILDADSIMRGETLVRLAQAMDANPNVGMIQTAPQLVRGTSLFQRLIQFSTRTLGPIFTAGSNFWHLAGGSYWGHNAIIRLKPFMEHCVLPELPSKDPKERHILSHDTIEAALMQQAGYQVWLAYDEPGSYEEGPPNLTESLKRDRRWCQGNLQHFWFLFAPGTRFTNRIHIFFGLMAYLASPLLILFVALSAIDFYWKERFAVFSAQLTQPSPATLSDAAVLLLGLTLALLFLPKLFGWLLMLRDPGPFGGVLKATVSMLLETVLAVLIAPILLFYYTRFVVMTLLGLRVTWKTQNRTDTSIPFLDAVREYLAPTLLGIGGAALAISIVPKLALWLSPILVGWCLAIPFAMITSSEALGATLRRHGIFVIPEEITSPPELLGLDRPPAILLAPEALRTAGNYGLLQAVLSPYVNAIHVAILRRSTIRSRLKQNYIASLRSRLLTEGPEALSRRELMALLGDPDGMGDTHREIWKTAEANLHPWWRYGMHHYNEAGASLARWQAAPAEQPAHDAYRVGAES